jgi:hypothetical protein
MTDRPLSEELVELMESGVSIMVGTRDARLRPWCVRAQGAVVGADRRHVTVFLPVATSERAVRDLEDNGRIALTFSRPFDHRTIQLKGRAVRVRAGTPQDRVRQERYRAALCEQLHVVGMSRAATRRLSFWPCHAVDVLVEASFEQTPGPSAGHPLGRES